MVKVKLVFVGGNPAGTAVLKSVAENKDCEVLGVVPNKSERGGVIDEATRMLMPLLSVERVAELKDLDLLLSVHSGTIIREPVLSLPRHGGLNVHFSLLPRHRGMFPLGHAILEGDEYTGVTVHKIDRGLDTGPILFQERFPISPSDTYHTLYTEGTNRAVRLVNAAIGQVASGRALKFREQVGEPSYHDRSSYPPNEIDLCSGPKGIRRHVRALTSPRYEPPHILIGGTKFYVTPKLATDDGAKEGET